MVTVVTISTPSSAEKGEQFNVTGIVYESTTGNPISGALINIYYDGKSLGSATTGIDGDYFDSVRIDEAGYFELESLVGTARASRFITITEPEPEPEPGWEYDSTYRGIDIQVWMPDGTPFTAYFDGEWHTAALLSTLQAAIDDFLEPEPEPPTGEITIKIVTTETDPYSRYHGKAIDQSLDSNFWSTQPDKIIKITGAGFTHTQTVGVAEGSHYVIYGNSASTGYIWHGQIFVNDTLIAEGVVDRGNQLRGDFTVGVPPPVGIPTTTTITVPDKVGVGEKFIVSGILYETESGIPITNQPINHSYDGRTLGSSTTGIDGDYLKEVSIPEAGVWTLKSEFPGTETLQVSRSQADAIVAASPLEAAIAIIGSAATGLAMIIYGLS